MTSDNATVANYSYLWDGTKLSAKTGEGAGLAYRGSFTYHCGEDFPAIEAFESTTFGGGRIVATDGNPEVHYFLTDHLGSVRVVATDKDNVLERNDYQPFGKRWNTASMPVADNRDRFNGKEDQAFTGLPFSDYGARMYDPERGRWFTQDPLQQYHSPYVFCGSNPINNIDVDGNWSVSNHYKMTLKSLALYGITGEQAELLSYYASMYADNPDNLALAINNLLHLKYSLYKRSDIDFSGTEMSQETDWDPSSPHENANIRHSMRSNWEAEAYENGIEGGISKREAQLRGMSYGWENILASAEQGSLISFKKNSVGIELFGVGLHALQDGYGHAGVSMEEHKAVADVCQNKRSSKRITQSAIYVHQIVSGDCASFRAGICHPLGESVRAVDERLYRTALPLRSVVEDSRGEARLKPAVRRSLVRSLSRVPWRPVREAAFSKLVRLYHLLGRSAVAACHGVAVESAVSARSHISVKGVGDACAGVIAVLEDGLYAALSERICIVRLKVIVHCHDGLCCSLSVAPPLSVEHGA